MYFNFIFHCNYKSKLCTWTYSWIYTKIWYKNLHWIGNDSHIVKCSPRPMEQIRLQSVVLAVIKAHTHFWALIPIILWKYFRNHIGFNRKTSLQWSHTAFNLIKIMKYFLASSIIKIEIEQSWSFFIFSKIYFV
jgi:hypothetical protein